MNAVDAPGGYSRAELEDMLTKMEAASSVFYGLAVRSGCHAFIEFTGLMNEFIKVCRQTMDAGIAFAFSNTHNDTPLVVHPYNMQYMAEKLDCIFGPVFRASPEMRDVFLNAMDFPAPAPAPPEPQDRTPSKPPKKGFKLTKLHITCLDAALRSVDGLPLRSAERRASLSTWNKLKEQKLVKVVKLDTRIIGEFHWAYAITAKGKKVLLRDSAALRSERRAA
jgi:hypothetical protein